MSQSSNESTVLEISLLGGFGLRVGGREIVVSRKARALIAYLAINPGQPAARDTVSDLLWSRRGAEQQRHSLRQTLVELRRVFAAEGDVLRSGSLPFGLSLLCLASKAPR